MQVSFWYRWKAVIQGSPSVPKTGLRILSLECARPAQHGTDSGRISGLNIMIIIVCKLQRHSTARNPQHTPEQDPHHQTAHKPHHTPTHPLHSTRAPRKTSRTAAARNALKRVRQPHDTHRVRYAYRPQLQLWCARCFVVRACCEAGAWGVVRFVCGLVVRLLFGGVLGVAGSAMPL